MYFIFKMWLFYFGNMKGERLRKEGKCKSKELYTLNYDIDNTRIEFLKYIPLITLNIFRDFKRICLF